MSERPQFAEAEQPPALSPVEENQNTPITMAAATDTEPAVQDESAFAWAMAASPQDAAPDIAMPRSAPEPQPAPPVVESAVQSAPVAKSRLSNYIALLIGCGLLFVLLFTPFARITEYQGRVPHDLIVDQRESLNLRFTGFDLILGTRQPINDWDMLVTGESLAHMLALLGPIIIMASVLLLGRKHRKLQLGAACFGGYIAVMTLAQAATVFSIMLQFDSRHRVVSQLGVGAIASLVIWVLMAGLCIAEIKGIDIFVKIAKPAKEKNPALEGFEEVHKPVKPNKNLTFCTACGGANLPTNIICAQCGKPI